MSRVREFKLILHKEVTKTSLIFTKFSADKAGILIKINIKIIWILNTLFDVSFYFNKAIMNIIMMKTPTNNVK